jgi:hypothetical protein
MVFEKGNTLGKTGRPKGAKNRITNDVRQVFHRVYDEMGAHVVDEKTKKPLSGHQAMLEWARDNPTEFYRLYGKMIPATAELPADLHEDFIDELVFEDELPKLVDAKDVTDMGKEGQKQLTDGETSPKQEAKNPDNAPSKTEPDYMP